jgi:signal transduction histidine kinase
MRSGQHRAQERTEQMSAAAQDYACPPAPRRRSLRWFTGLLRASEAGTNTQRKQKKAIRDSFCRADFTEHSGAIPNGAVDLVAEARAALGRVKAYMPGIRLQFAAESGLTARIDPRALGQLLDLLLGSAADAAPSGRILLGAMAEAGFIRIVVLDEGATSTRAQVIRQAGELAGRHAGSLEVESTAGDEGTLAVLRLPAA